MLKFVLPLSLMMVLLAGCATVTAEGTGSSATACMCGDTCKCCTCEKCTCDPCECCKCTDCKCATCCKVKAKAVNPACKCDKCGCEVCTCVEGKSCGCESCKPAKPTAGCCGKR